MLSVEFGLKLIKIVGVYSLLQTSRKQIVDLLVVDEIRPKKQKAKDRSWGVTPTLGFSNLTHGISQISGWFNTSMAIYTGNLEDDHFVHPLKAGEKNHFWHTGTDVFLLWDKRVFRFFRFLNQTPLGQTFIAAVLWS